MIGEPRGGCSRRQFLALSLSAVPVVSGALAACQRFVGDRDPEGMPGGMPDWMMSQDEMLDPDMMRDMPVIHDLLVHHQDIHRRVQHLSYGIRATTTSARPDVAERIRTHVEQMKSRLERGAPIRQKDPLFAEIFERAHQIDLQIKHLPDGVWVAESSRDPLTVMLIRQHARRAVSEFVAAGMNRAMHPTPLPESYPG